MSTFIFPINARRKTVLRSKKSVGNKKEGDMALARMSAWQRRIFKVAVTLLYACKF